MTYERHFDVLMKKHFERDARVVIDDGARIAGKNTH